MGMNASIQRSSLRRTLRSILRRTPGGISVVAAIVLGAPSSGWTLDCARVQQLTDGGMGPAAVARELGITTPDVQACLAGVVEAPAPGERRPQRVPFNIPGSADELRRPPNS